MMPKQNCPPIGWMLLDLGFAFVRRAGQVAADTRQEWKRVCEEQERAERREEERDANTST